MELTGASVIEWGVAARRRGGEAEFGDGYLVKSIPDGALIAVADGLGHGADAAVAAQMALALVGAHSLESPVALLRRCHQALRGTRGAVMSVAFIQARSNALIWLAVGNVTGVVIRASAAASPPWETLNLRSGILGKQIPPLLPTVVVLAPGDAIVLATEGVRWNPGDVRVRLEAPEEMARRLVDEHATGADDALVVVARYRGGAMSTTRPDSYAPRSAMPWSKPGGRSG